MNGQNFNGEGDFHEAGVHALDSNFSFSLWFNSSDLLSGNKTLVDFGGIYWLKTTSQREIQISHQPSMGEYNTVDLELSQYNWYHVVFCVRYPDASVYLNGEIVKSFKFKKDAPKSSAKKIILGRNSWREFYKGQVSNFHFYDSCISQKQLTDLFENEYIPKQITDNILAFLPLDDNIVFGDITTSPIFSSIQYVHDSLRGKVARFDSLSYIDLGNVKMDNAITLSAWVKPVIKGRQALISSGHAFAYRINFVNNFLFTIPQIVDIYAKERTVITNQWQHIAVTYHEKKNVCFYINGKKQEVVYVDEAQQAAKKIRIGNNLWNDHYIGYMDDIVVWNRVLSEDEVFAVSKMNAVDIKSQMPSSNTFNKWPLVIGSCIIGLLGYYYIFYKRKKKFNNDGNNQFRQKVEIVVNENLNDSTFGVDRFAELMALSKTSLYNRMKASFNKSPKEYIREVRIKKASELLQNTDHSISEVIFETGFESRAYFNKCFKDKYNTTPSLFRKKDKLI